MNTTMLHATLALLLTTVTACASQTATPDQLSGVGTAQFALTGALPGVTHLTLSIYDGAVGNISAQSPTFQPIVCAQYGGAGGNRIKLQYLKASSNYTLYVEMFSDDKCEKRVGFGWRGNVEVIAGNDLAATVPTYYVQPYLFGQFTGLAPVPPSLQDPSKLPSCNNDQDCKGVHVNATCGAGNKCVVDTLSPLDGYARRGFANSLPLADGSVAVFGGLTAPTGGNWVATNQQAEVFDPLLGYFRAVSGSPAFTPVGLAMAVTDGAQAVAIVGGSTDSSFALDPGKTLKTTIDATGCSSAACPVSNLVQRWDLVAETKLELPMTAAPGSLPIVSRVHTKNGDRLLIAGGAKAPISKNLDSRQAIASVCDLTQKDAITCTSNDAAHSPIVQRANAATVCRTSMADGTCTSLFILGGRKTTGTDFAEAYDALSNTFVPVTPKGGPLLHGGSLVKLASGNFLLLGAALQAPFIEDDVLTGGVQLQPPTVVAVAEGPSSLTMQTAALPMGAFAAGDGGKRLLAATVSLRDGSILLIGGIDEKLQPLADALLFDPSGVPVARIAMAAPRVGATASLIGGQNPLGGCVLLAGGFTTSTATGANGALIPQNHVEVFCPGP